MLKCSIKNVGVCFVTNLLKKIKNYMQQIVAYIQ